MDTTFELTLSNLLLPPDAHSHLMPSNSGLFGKLICHPGTDTRPSEGGGQTRLIRNTDPSDKQAGGQENGARTYGKQLSRRSQIGGL